jgi:hypothetical protein
MVPQVTNVRYFGPLSYKYQIFWSLFTNISHFGPFCQSIKVSNICNLRDQSEIKKTQGTEVSTVCNLRDQNDTNKV